MKFKNLFSSLIIFLVIGASAQAQGRREYIIFDGLLTSAAGSVNEGAVIKLVCSGRNEYLKFDAETGKFQVRVGLDRDCEISFTKPGFISTSIFLNTICPKDRLEEGFPDYELNVTLRPEVANVPFTIKHEIAYDENVYNFDFKEDFNRSTNRQLKEYKAITSNSEKIAAEKARLAEEKLKA